MSQIERDFMRQVDELVLTGSPELLRKLAEIDTASQMSGRSFYDIYSSLSDEDKRQIIVLAKK
jgi:hypothetical protein